MTVQQRVTLLLICLSVVGTGHQVGRTLQCQTFYSTKHKSQVGTTYTKDTVKNRTDRLIL